MPKSLPRLLLTYTHALNVLRGVASPFLDVLTRIWLGQQFFVSGLIKLTHWQTALDLAAHEYPVSWMGPHTAAVTGVLIETVASLLLITGFLTRYAALSLLALTLVIQFAYQAHDSQLFWAALLLWYSVRGAGGLSLDKLLRRGLADSALPLIPRILRVTEFLRMHLGPWTLTLIRLWIGCALLNLSAGWVADAYLPSASFGMLSHGAAGALGGALLLGLFTRGVSLLLILVGISAPMLQDAYLYDNFETLTLLLMIVWGSGRLSIDRLIRSRLAKPKTNAANAPRVVIIGAGFGGLSCANALRHANVSVTLIDRGNHHLFQPLLYQVATAALSPGDIATPTRSLFRDADNTRVLLGTVDGVDLERKCVSLGAQLVPYDYLVLATGATHGYFGKDQWQSVAPGLKRIEDATEIRRRLLVAFERAEACDDGEDRAALLTFLIVGGGPTGVELAGAIAELARFGMDKEFRRFDPASARVILVQSGPRILPTFPETLSQRAHASLEKLGVSVRLNSRVEDIDADGVRVSGEKIAARTVLWAAGVTASPAARWLGVSADSAGRVKVDATLQVEGCDSVWAIGDTAASLGWRGKPVPGLAPAAKQGGKYVAGVIEARISHRPAPPAFRYRHLGSLATIGRQAAVADFGRLKLWGAPAWWLWGLIHVGFLVGVRNRLATMVNWFWSYLTFGGGIRLITGAEPASTGSNVRPGH